MLVSASLEYAIHPEREQPRLALAKVNACAGDIVRINSSVEGGSEFTVNAANTGKLVSAIATNGFLPSRDVTITVTRKGGEILRVEGIKDLFGVVYF
jgi:hypothetical protein